MPASQWPGMLQMKKYLPGRSRLKTVAPSVCVTAPALSQKSYCCLFTLTTLCASALYTNSATHKTSHRYTHTNSRSVLPQSYKQSIPSHTHTLQRSLEQLPAAGRPQYCRKLQTTSWYFLRLHEEAQVCVSTLQRSRLTDTVTHDIRSAPVPVGERGAWVWVVPRNRVSGSSCSSWKLD